jgi:hypothetical protein
MYSVYMFSQKHNLGLVYIDALSTGYSFSVVVKTFFAEILVLLGVMIHI